MRPSKNLRSLFLQTLVVISVALWLASSILAGDYAGTRPGAPEPGEGRVYSLTTRERVVYLSLPECLLFYGLMGLGYGGGIATVTIGVRWKLTGKL